MLYSPQKIWYVENDNCHEYVYKFYNESVIFSIINLSKQPLKFDRTGIEFCAVK